MFITITFYNRVKHFVQVKRSKTETYELKQMRNMKILEMT